MTIGPKVSRVTAPKAICKMINIERVVDHFLTDRDSAPSRRIHPEKNNK